MCEGPSCPTGTDSTDPTAFLVVTGLLAGFIFFLLAGSAINALVKERRRKRGESVGGTAWDAFQGWLQTPSGSDDGDGGD